MQRLKKKYIGLMLVILLVLGGLSAGTGIGGGRAYAAADFAGGTGTAADPYWIKTPAQLNKVRNYMDKSFVLRSDIDLSSYSTDEGWEPIGDGDVPFNGNIDGGGYAISGLKINRPGEDFLGLFGKTDTDSKISNMRLLLVEVEGGIDQQDAYAGSLSGWNKGTITGSYATGSVSGRGNNYGGLAGKNEGTINGSYATVNVITNNDYVGGLTGYNNGVILNSYSEGSVTGHDLVGGLVGKSHRKDWEAGVISNSYATGKVTGDSNVGGLIGQLEGTNITSSYYDMNKTGQSDSYKGEGKETAEMKDQDLYQNWDFTNIWGINSSRNNGYPSLQAIQVYLTYDGNASSYGTVPFDANRYRPGSTVITDLNNGSTRLTREGYNFTGWNTQADGKGTSYAAGALFVISKNTTLYAKWDEIPSSKATLTTTLGTVSLGGTANESLSDIPYGTSLAALKSALTPAVGATFEIYDEDGITVASQVATGTKVIVTAADTITTVTYRVTVLPSNKATLTTTLGTVSLGGTANESLSDIPYGTSIAALKSALTPAAGATFEIYNEDGITVASQVATGTKVIVTAADTITKVTYQVTVNPAPVYGGGNPTTTYNSTNGSLYLPAGQAGTVSSQDGAISITIPGKATDKNLQVTINKVEDVQQLLTHHEILISNMYDVLKNFPDNFVNPIAMTIVFDSAKLNGTLTPVVFYYDESKHAWLEVSGSLASGSQITVSVNQFAKYAVFAVDRNVQPSTGSQPDMKLSDIGGSWAESAIRQAISSGMVSGYPDATFKPDHAVTRAEFTMMLVNALKLQGEAAPLSFTDTSEIGTWARQAVAHAIQAGILKGYADGTFRPEAEITRAEMAVMIANALGQLQNETAFAIGFADDNAIPEWAKGAVAILKEKGLVNGTGGNKFAPATHTTRAEAVVMLLRLLSSLNK